MNRNQSSRIVVCRVIAMAVLLCGALPLAAADAAGCKDHPLFSRMKSMAITLCKTVDFDRFEFKTAKTTSVPVEGRLFQIRYMMDGPDKPPSALAIIRNHQQAIGKIGKSHCCQ